MVRAKSRFRAITREIGLVIGKRVACEPQKMLCSNIYHG